MLLAVVSTLLIGFASPSYKIMLAWLFIYSLGQHLFIPVGSSIGMELARDGRPAGDWGSSTPSGTSPPFSEVSWSRSLSLFGFRFPHAFAMSAVAFAVASILMFMMERKSTQRPKTILRLRREYSLYYLLSVLYGSRKQLFLTFAPWVLVSVFHQPVQILATLLMIGGVIGIGFQPLLGAAIDRLGERTVLVLEAAVLVFVCIGYGFSKDFMFVRAAFLVTCACFLVDQMLMSVNMARSTYIKKIALDPSHVQPALTSSVTIDHIFPITIALVGGTIWSVFGFQYVFLMGAAIALLNFAAALRIRIPKALAGRTDDQFTADRD